MSEQVMGEQPSADIAALLGRATELKAAIEESRADGQKVAELEANWKQVREDITTLQAEENKRQAEAKASLIQKEMEDFLASQRTPSKAHLITGARPESGNGESFFATVAFAGSPRLAGSVKAQLEAQEKLETHFGSTWAAVPSESKATLGDSDAAGGYLVPNNVVADVNLQASPLRSVVDMFTVVTDVRGSAVDIPFQSAAGSRAVIAAPGATKENSNFAVNNYTATLYTLARIFDVSNQLLRQSQGAAERLVRTDLAQAFGLGEDYYALQGTGSSQPYGLLTALGTSGTYVTSHTAAATLAGSVFTAIANAAGDLADRGAIPDGVVMNSGDFWTTAAQGSDNAGFFMGNPMQTNVVGAGQDVAGPFGLRWRHSPNMPTDSLVVGEFRRAFFFRGQAYRVDVSSEAGDRWDKNLTGFRGEEEIAFDARPAVYTGRFQRITNAVP